MKIKDVQFYPGPPRPSKFRHLHNNVDTSLAQFGLASKGPKFSLFFKVGKDLKTAVGPGGGGRSAEYKNKGIMAYFHRISGREGGLSF